MDRKKCSYRLRIAAASGFLVLWTVPVIATAEEKGSEPNCAKIQDAVQRLQCFDSNSARNAEEQLAGADELAARKAAAEILIDPESARFGQFTLVSPVEACITVNAKNKMGGYAGNKEIALVKGPHGWSAIDIVESPILFKDQNGKPVYGASDREVCIKLVTGFWQEAYGKQVNPGS